MKKQDCPSCSMASTRVLRQIKILTTRKYNDHFGVDDGDDDDYDDESL